MVKCRYVSSAHIIASVPGWIRITSPWLVHNLKAEMECTDMVAVITVSA
jgi:hypothetical protein